MTGKIFENSSNIYQDQAKILFDYYKTAAETIVAAEMEEEQNKADLIKQRDSMIAERDKAKMISTVCFVLFILVITLIVGLVYMFKQKKYQAEVERFERMIAECDERHRNIRREYKVDKIGVVYVPVATKVPFEDKSIVLDHTGTVDDTDFNLTLLNQPEDFQDSVQQLSDMLDKLPVVEDNTMTETVNTSEYSTSIQSITLYDYMGSLDRQVRNISYLLGDNRNASVKIPVIAPDGQTAQYLNEYATTETGSHNVVKVFDVSFDERLEKFASLNALKDQVKTTGDSDSNEYIRRLMRRLAESVQLLTKTKISSQSKLINYTSSIFNLVLKSGYTQYSPSLEAEEIERARSESFFDYRTAVNDYTPFSLKSSSIVRYELLSSSWIAEDGSRTSMPFGMHQIDEEIFMPVIASLMEENRIERLKIYNNIDDQKRMYVDRWKTEIGNYFRDNRKTADELITHMRETYSDYMNAYNMYKSLLDTSNSMKSSGSIENSEVKEIESQAEMIAGFEAQASQCNQQQEAFAEFMDRINDSIDESTKKFEFIEYFEGSLRDTMAHDTAIAFSDLQSLDNRRRSLVGVSPYVANKAVLLPEPTISPDVFEGIHMDLMQKVNNSIGAAEPFIASDEAVMAAMQAEDTAAMPVTDEAVASAQPVDCGV
ncbi:MAG: hypothetical protein IJZ95_08960 [Oscillospiraceae bacterium]|nr:hypothetical protein [Oscillospiraceae bacterium]